MRRALGITAAALAATGVMLGAFGAHALRGRIDDAALQIWHTAVEYQLWHALAVLLIAGAAPRPLAAWWRTSAFAFVIGIVLFSGSLYALALGAPHWLGALTPLGGVAFLGGWLTLIAAWCSAAHD